MHDLNTIKAQNQAAEDQHKAGIERAAQAIYEDIYPDDSDFTWSEEDEIVKEDARNIARLAIAAYNGES